MKDEVFGLAQESYASEEFHPETRAIKRSKQLFKPTPANKEDMINLGVGEPHSSLFPKTIFKDIFNITGINKYYSPYGDVVLKDTLIDRYYPTCKTDNLLITNGGIGALDLISRAFLGKGDHLLIPDPGFPPYRQLGLLQGATVDTYPIALQDNSRLIDWDTLEEKITPATKFILINSPHNPTGKIFSAEDKKRLLAMLQAYPELRIIMDEVYREILFNNHQHIDLSKQLDRVLIVGSFSKMFPLQGLRIGWILAHEDILAKIYPFVQNCIGAVSSVGQEMAKLCLKTIVTDAGFYKNNLDIAKAILDKQNIDYIEPEGTFYLFIHCGSNTNKVAQDLKTLGVQVLAGEAFGPRSAQYIRVSLSNIPESVRKGITLIANYLTSA